MRYIILAIIFGFCYSKEPSAFESQSGATKKEIQTIKNDIKSHSDSIIDLERQIKQINTSFEGLKSIYPGYFEQLKMLSDDVRSFSDNNDKISKEMDAFRIKLDEQAKNIDLLSNSLSSIKDSISQVKDMIISISSYNDKDYKKTETNNKVAIDAKNDIKKSNTINLKDDFTKDHSKVADIFKEARHLTYTNKFNDAISRYKWLVEINYRKSESLYMLGNIAYASNKYNDAINYYKESATLDDKAKYMPRLLLNTANSFKVLNDIDNAKKFYNSILSVFKDSIEAKEATKQLARL